MISDANYVQKAGVTHEFFGMGLSVSEAERVEQLVVQNLKHAVSSAAD